MAASFILFYAVNPLLALGMGVLAENRRQWLWPVIAAVVFLLGARLIFSPRETAFLPHAGVYLAL